ncbi:MAG: methylenetetrahydrofolate reductase [NAD(P)H] [Actinomycetota bacterium]
MAARTGVTRSVGELLRRGEMSFSFELFPPKTPEGEVELWATVRRLEALSPTFLSVTYGAGGSSRDRTVRITTEIAQDTTILPVAHLTCVGASREDVRGVIQEYAAGGITNMLALRGDPPASGPWEPHPDGLVHADELVAMIRSLGDFSVGVAAFPEGHPESPDRDSDARVLARKQEMGAEYAITQLFFQAEDYARLVERAHSHGCTMPILPGIMPVTNLSQIERFSALSGADFPADLAARFAELGDDAEAVRALGVEVGTELCSRLLDAGAPGLHFYTLNRSTATIEIYRNLDLHAAHAS